MSIYFNCTFCLYNMYYEYIFVAGYVILNVFLKMRCMRLGY